MNGILYFHLLQKNFKMAKAKETFYFSHDYNSRSDRKMMNLIMTCGIEGIGIYWCIVEMLYEEGGYLMRSECERIAFELRTDCERINKVIKSSLFCMDEEKFWSQSVLTRIELRREKSEKAKLSASHRDYSANGMRSHIERYAIKERKGKEIKAVSFENDFAIFPDGSKQELSQSQKIRVRNDDLKPSEVRKGYVS